jgi:O-methyltransferase
VTAQGTEGMRTEQLARAPVAPADLSAAEQVALGRARQAEGDLAGAEAHYARALALVHSYGPAIVQLRVLARHQADRAEDCLDRGDAQAAKSFLVRAVELDPRNPDYRRRLDATLDPNRRDITKQCFVHFDQARGEAVYRETFRRALEYVASSGIVGDYMEFGVLGGFTARIVCETMREMLMIRNVHLFDSFEGLPPFVSPVDANSYDVAVRGVWADNMCFPDDFIAALGEPVDRHIHRGLSEVVSGDRVRIRRGYFSDTLKEPIGAKAAVVHVDCDLYQSTREVFTRLYETGVFQDGCVLLFDDFNCFKASPYFGERRAFREFLAEQDRFEASPWFTYGFNGAAYFLHERQD